MQTSVYMKFRNGAITEAALSTSACSSRAAEERAAFESVLKGKSIHEIKSWADELSKAMGVGAVDGMRELAAWLDGMFGKGNPATT